jgi:hypothetical protein
LTSLDGRVVRSGDRAANDATRTAIPVNGSALRALKA